MAILSSELDQITGAVASLGFNVAFKEMDSPSPRVMLVRLSEMNSTGTSTVTTQEALLPPALAVMVAFPPPTAVTLPLESTVATVWLELDHVTVLSEVSSGLRVATSVSDWPFVSVSSDLLSVMD